MSEADPGFQAAYR